jgi:hypothetical protein
LSAENHFFKFKNIVCPLDYVVWVGLTTVPFPFADDLLNQTEYNMTEFYAVEVKTNRKWE